MQKQSINIRNEELIQPYDLKGSDQDSSGFYQKLECFTDVVVQKGDQVLGDYLHRYLKTNTHVKNREDALLDFLILGVLWNQYAGAHVRFLKMKNGVLAFLYHLRKVNTTLKKQTDQVRGKLASRWLGERSTTCDGYNKKKMKQFQLFLSATCEFKEDLKRIDLINDFLLSLTQAESRWLMNEIINFSLWFKASAKEHLGMVTHHVENFRQIYKDQYYGKEDYFFSLKSEAEYHLNMVGASLMNRSLREEFNQTKKQVLLLPTCMSSGKNCKAVSRGNDLQCMHCNKNCRISQLTKEMDKAGVKTVLIKHSSKFSEWLKPWADQKETGLVGVACVLNLLMGGFEMKHLNIPSQCVFLDFCGCKKHWLTGIPTDINTDQVQKTIAGLHAYDENNSQAKCIHSL